MHASPSIRTVTPEDFAQWRVLWDGYNAFYGRSGPTALAPEITAMTWARFFDAYEPVHAMVAEKDGQLLGLVHYLFHRNTAMIGPTCYLQDLFTNETARGAGVGRALVDAALDAARARGAARIELDTNETNTGAIALYERAGFSASSKTHAHLSGRDVFMGRKL